MDIIRDHIKRLIEQYGTLRKAAEAISVSHQTLYNAQKGSWPSRKLAKALKLDLAAITKEKEPLF